MSSTGLLTTVALAATSSLTVLAVTSSDSNGKNGKSVKWLEPIAVAIGLPSLSSSTPTTTSTTQIATTTTTTTATTSVTAASTAAAPGVPAMKLGINLAGPEYYVGSRNFSNLMAGGIWTLINASGQWVTMPGDRLDTNKNVIVLNSGEKVARQFSPPTVAYRGVSTDIVCRWQGKGTVMMFGDVVRNVRTLSSNSLTFTFVPKGGNSGTFIYNKIDPADPLRNIDCREKDADPNALFDPAFLAEVKRYSTVRYLKWTRSVESNYKVTWAKRTKPGDGIINGSDSIPIEYMVALANQAKVNPWFTIPWNADDDYIRRMATYVRDNLDPSLKAYVETSNEVWNYQYAVTTAAKNEALAQGWTGDELAMILRRYAQRTGQVMDIWTDVYAGQMPRLVRVAATQNGAWFAGVVLKSEGVAKKVDALATAPYFAATLKAGQLADPAVMDRFFTNRLTTVDEMIAGAKATKAVATQYGLRYLTYEAGQHFLSPDDVDQLVRVSRDPRMGKLYTRYLTGWKDQVGDLMTLFIDYGGPGKYGAWGQQEYIGQPLADAPKANAVELFRQSYVK